jgi:CheY-like chemotaxis protein
MAKILIVEADRMTAEVASIMTRADRHIVTVVDKALEALLLLDAVPFDVVLIALALPQLDGLRLTRLIRGTDARYARIPIVGLAGKHEAVDLELLYAIGMNRLLFKPFRDRELLEVLEDLLGPRPGTVSVWEGAEERPSDGANLRAESESRHGALHEH